MGIIRVRNSRKNQRVAALVAETVKLVPAHWKAFLPSIDIWITESNFDEVRQLRQLCLDGASADSHYLALMQLRILRVVCESIEMPKSILWVHFNESIEDYGEIFAFKKDLIMNFAGIAWTTSDTLRDCVLDVFGAQRPTQISRIRSLFCRDLARFLLTSELLHDHNKAIWTRIAGIDRCLKLVEGASSTSPKTTPG